MLKSLFCSVDYCYVTKNVRNQFLERNLHTKEKSVTGDFAVRLFEEQKGKLITAIRTWTSKHVMPNNIERKDLKPKIYMFKPGQQKFDVECMLQLKQGFVDVERTVKFTKRLHRWISLHDVCNVKQHQRYTLLDKMLYFAGQATTCLGI
jgi:hypothetical protein